MLSIQEIRLGVENCRKQIRAIEIYYQDKKKGITYDQKINYWHSRIESFGEKLSKLGAEGVLIVVEGTRIENLGFNMTLKKKFRIYYTNITREDAEALTRQRDKTCKDLTSRTIALGTFFAR